MIVSKLEIITITKASLDNYVAGRNVEICSNSFSLPLSRSVFLSHSALPLVGGSVLLCLSLCSNQSKTHSVTPCMLIENTMSFAFSLCLFLCFACTDGHTDKQAAHKHHLFSPFSLFSPSSLINLLHQVCCRHHKQTTMCFEFCE